MDKVYSVMDVYDILGKIGSVDVLKKKGGQSYLDIIAAFDIKTSPIYNGYNRYMYLWAFILGDYVFVGRKWSEALGLMTAITEYFALYTERLLVWVPNLAFVFQYLLKRFEWIDVFAMEVRHPLAAVTITGIEFRNVASLRSEGTERLIYDDVAKHYDTELSDMEVNAFVLSLRDAILSVNQISAICGGLHKMPYTKTGVLRRIVRNTLLPFGSYSRLMRKLTITGLDEMRCLSKAFWGGLCFANSRYLGETISHVYSYDIKSAYPYVLLTEGFPMSKGELIELDNMATLKQDSDFLYVVEVELTDVHLRSLWIDVGFSIIKAAKIEYDKAYSVCRHGYIISSKWMRLTVTNIDWSIVDECYSYKTSKVLTCYRYTKELLPKPYRMFVAGLYKAKENAKTETGKAYTKQLLNSLYGMIVMNPLRRQIRLTEMREWEAKVLTELEQEKELSKYNANRVRFSFYPWGVFVPSYMRKRLFEMIKANLERWVYVDTDAIKVINGAPNITDLNKAIRQRRLETIDWRCDLGALGEWIVEYIGAKFKVVGQKRYISEVEGQISCVCSGLNPNRLTAYICTQKCPFDAFNERMIIDGKAVGFYTYAYIDDGCAGTQKDLNGVLARVEESSCIATKTENYISDVNIQMWESII